MLIGVDIGGTKTAVVMATLAGEVVAQQQQPTDVAHLAAGVAAAIRATVGDEPVTAIGVGVPGMVNRAAGTVELATNLGIEQPLPLAALISAEFAVPVVLENDARLAALGVYRLFREPNLAYLSIGTGIAAGIIRDHELWRGNHGMAGEIGHIVLDDSGVILEKQAAGPAIVAQARAAGLTLNRAGDVYTAAAAGDARAQTVVAQASRHIARAIQWLIMTYDVEKVILGGGVTHVGDDFMRPLLTELARLRDHSALNAKMLPDSKVLLMPPDYNAGLHGALWLAAQAGAA